MPENITCPQCQAALRIREEYAGKEVKCPHCATPFVLPKARKAKEGEEEALEVTAAEPEKTPARAPAAVATRPCPECGKRIAAAAQKCRYCKAWLEDGGGDEEEEDEDAGPRYKRCPRCSARDPKKVIFTFWGSFYFTALFSHVRCRKCHYGYNGRTGRSNLVPAIICVTVPLIMILGIIAAVVALVFSRGYGPG